MDHSNSTGSDDKDDVIDSQQNLQLSMQLHRKKSPKKVVIRNSVYYILLYIHTNR